MKPANSDFSVMSRLKSFGFAFNGLIFMLKTQHNAWVHAAASLGVVALSFWLRLSAEDWRWIIAAIVMVWVAETFNTAVEYVCDVVSPSHNEAVKYAKDIAAGAVLIAALAAALIGLITLGPPLLAHFTMPHK